MCTDCKVERVPIKVPRKPITVVSDNGYNSGGWAAIPPYKQEPFDVKLRRGQKLYWCPWCGAWNVYQAKPDGQSYCTGWCGWGNTAEFYTRTYNNLWG